MKEINAFEHSNVVSDKFKGFQSVILWKTPKFST